MITGAARRPFNSERCRFFGAVTLLASLAYTLEQALAFGDSFDGATPIAGDVPLYSDYADSDRWTVATELADAAAS